MNHIHASSFLRRCCGYVFLLLLGWSTLVSCRREAFLVFIQPPKKFATERTPTAPNYALSTHWHVANRRFSNKRADVFFVHPTTYIRGKTWNQHLDDARVNGRTQYSVIRYQTSLFYDSCNVFMPKYRQAVFSSFVDKKGNGAQALELAYKDVKTAFYYYWKHYNDGRPFFIASHSQGSRHCKRLMAELLEDTKMRDQFIAAYLIGWPIEAAYVRQTPHMEVCSTATQTGCIISWNSQSPEARTTMADALSMKGAMVCVNPLSWTLDTSYQPAVNNRGALLNNEATDKPELLLHFCSAQVQGGILEANLASDSRRLKTPLSKGNYHIYDYNFFYQNVRDNIAQRMAAYFEEQEDSDHEARR